MRLALSMTIAFLCVGCLKRTNNESARTQDVIAGGADFSELKCDDNGSFAMRMHLHPDAIESKVSAADTKLKMGTFAFTPAEFVEFGLCGSPAGEVTIKRLNVIRSMSVGAWTRRVDALLPEDDSYKAKLGEAIGSGDFSQIEIPFVSHTPKGPSFLLKGWKRSDGISFLTLSTFNPKSKTPLTVVNPERFDQAEFHGVNAVVFGELKEGGARDQAEECNKNRRNKRFELAGASIEINYCYRGNHAIYINYDFSSLTINDKNTGESISLTGASKVETMLKVTQTHHSLTDAFVITTPSATYTIGGPSQKFLIKYNSNRFPSQEAELKCNRVYECGTDIEVPQPM